MSASSLEADVEAVSRIIVDKLVDPDGSDNVKESLYAAAVDPVVATLALKVVLGIAASFVGRLFYDAWKACPDPEAPPEPG